MIPAKLLHRLRNELPVHQVLREELEVIVYFESGHWRFQCPLCHRYDTAANARTNLGRCFYCRKNFNTIDFVMLVRACGFLDAVHELKLLLPAEKTTQNAAGLGHR